MQKQRMTTKTFTRRQWVLGAAAAAGTAILAACSVEVGPTATAAPAATATALASPTRAASAVSGSVVTGSATATRAASAVSGSTVPGSVVTGSAAVATATRAPSAVVGSATAPTTGSATAAATATRAASAAAGSPSAVAGSAAAGSAAAGSAGAGMTGIRVVHASPDAPPVDVYIDGKQVVIALPFGKESGYQAVMAGRRDIQIFATGANPMRDKPVIDGRGTLVPDGRTSVVALGRAAMITGVLADDRTAPPAAGKAKVKFIHAAPDAPAVDIAIKGGAVLFPNTEFGKSYPYQEVDAKTYDLEVRPAGKTDVVLSVPGVALAAGQVYSIYALGLVNGTPKLSAALFIDNGR